MLVFSPLRKTLFYSWIKTSFMTQERKKQNKVLLFLYNFIQFDHFIIPQVVFTCVVKLKWEKQKQNQKVFFSFCFSFFAWSLLPASSFCSDSQCRWRGWLVMITKPRPSILTVENDLSVFNSFFSFFSWVHSIRAPCLAPAHEFAGNSDRAETKRGKKRRDEKDLMRWHEGGDVTAKKRRRRGKKWRKTEVETWVLSGSGWSWYAGNMTLHLLFIVMSFLRWNNY